MRSQNDSAAFRIRSEDDENLNEEEEEDENNAEDAVDANHEEKPKDENLEDQSTDTGGSEEKGPTMLNSASSATATAFAYLSASCC